MRSVESSKRTGPILIVGYGSIGRRHFQNLKHLGFNDFVFCRTRKGTLSDDETAAFPSVNRLEDALAYQPSIAVVANPTSLHMEVALQAAMAGCDLYIEKPLASELTNCDRLRSIVCEQKLVVMIGCQFRFHPLLIDLRNQLSNGRIGRVIGASAEWGEYLPGWHPWEDHKQSYSARSELGGGVILTLIHPLDYLYWLFGPVVRVTCCTAAVEALQTPAREDYAEIVMQFSNSTVGRVHLDYLQKPPVHRLTVFGDKGRALWDYHAGHLSWEMPDGEIDVCPVPSGFDRNSMFLDAMRHFLTCVDARRTPCVSLDDSIAVLKLALEARHSAAMAN
jgi:predicted dehydrogenase